MTTTLPVDAKYDQDPLRLLTIAANLLPVEITDARRGKKLTKIVVAVLVILVAGVIGWDVHARQQTSSAQGELNQARAQVLDLQKQERAYSTLTQTKNGAKAISAELSSLMASDLQWSKLLPALRATAPAGVTLTNVSGALTAGGVGGAPANGASNSVPGLTTGTPVGSITVSGSAPDKQSVANFVDALGTVSGLANPYINTATIQTGNIVLFTVQVEITSAALGGRYSASSTPTAGGH